MIVALVALVSVVVAVAALVLVPRVRWLAGPGASDREQDPEAGRRAREVGRRRRLGVLVVSGGLLVLSVRACDVVSDRQLDRREDALRAELGRTDPVELGITPAALGTPAARVGLAEIDERIEHAEVNTLTANAERAVLGLRVRWAAVDRCFDLTVDAGADYSLVEDDC